MRNVLFVGGLVLAGLGMATLAVAWRSVFRTRAALRDNGASGMSPLRAEIMVIGGWSIALAVGIVMIWKSGVLTR